MDGSDDRDAQAQQPLRVLLSAFACSPVRGSEEGSGWRWAVEIARRGHDVTILTRKNYLAEIETERALLDRLGVSVVAIDLAPRIDYASSPHWLSYAYIYVWQLLAVVVARRLHSQRSFDLVHHITFGGIRFPSFMWVLGLPFVLGPLGGGETAPLRLRRSYPLRGKIVDLLRDLSNNLVRIDPLMRLTFWRADLIYVRTRETLRLVPSKARARTRVLPEQGADLAPSSSSARHRGPGPLRTLFVGRLLYWKGVHFALAAVARARKEVDVEMTIVGDGPDLEHFKQVAADMADLGTVRWVGRLAQADVLRLYAACDVFLFPSLHDAGATVLYEAAANGLPVVGLKLGALAEHPVDMFGLAADTAGRSEDEVIDAMANELIRLACDPERRQTFSDAARLWAATVTWPLRIADAYSEIELTMRRPGSDLGVSLRTPTEPSVRGA